MRSKKERATERERKCYKSRDALFFILFVKGILEQVMMMMMIFRFQKCFGKDMLKEGVMMIFRFQKCLWKGMLKEGG